MTEPSKINTSSPPDTSVPQHIDLAMLAAWAINAATRVQGKEVDRLRLHDAINKNKSALNLLYEQVSDGTVDLSPMAWQAVIKSLANDSGINNVEIFDAPDPARLPVISWIAGQGWGIVRSLSAQNTWVIEQNGRIFQLPAENSLPCVRLAFDLETKSLTDKPVFRLFIKEFKAQKKIFVEAGIASVILNLLALVTSLYSMQVYDRVIPTQGYSTLAVLTLGVAIALIFDIIIKISRSHLMEHAVIKMDGHLSRAIFGRLLNIRMDQLPTSVGSLSAQVRGYETIRSFLSSSTFYVFIDAPFGIFFIVMIAIIGSPIAALVPLFFLIISIAFGLVMRSKIDAHAAQSTDANNKKTGLLVEAIEGAETIKSGAGSWNVLSKWIDTTQVAMHHEMSLKQISEKSSHVSAMLQQASYVGLIAVGAYLAAEGHMTMGALIACSILSGRALAPVTQIPGLIVQAAHSKAALNLLEQMFSLEVDNHEVDRPLIPQQLSGNYTLERVRFAYPASPDALVIPGLKIKSGEKIGILGPVGSGKSTLLRLLSGMYRPSEGRVLLDDLDIDQISRHFLGERIGYLQQDHRLFAGTLRENLLIGVVDPGDEAIKIAATRSGLLTAISKHPKGLELPIAEGGKGLSGGQRQLVAFTRLLISHPHIWLLDEPTASMDSLTEERCKAVLHAELKPEDTLILVTHKPNLLSLVDRLVVIVNHQIFMDGSRDEILKRLATPSSPQQGV